MTTNTSIIIIGGGITGLAAAYRLQSIAPHIPVVLIEKDARLGGKIRTERSTDFVVEGGPDSFLLSKPRGIGLCRDLGIEEHLQGTREETRGTYVMQAGRLHPMPEGLTGLIPSRLEALLDSDLFSADGKQRLRREPNIPPLDSGDDETLSEFVERRFGREVYDRLIEPLMAGIYAGNGEELSLQATFPQLRQLELDHGSLIRGLEATRPAPGARRPGFATPVGGMQEIVDALKARLTKTQIITEKEVRRVTKRDRGFVVTTHDSQSLRAHSVILAVPGYVAADILTDIAPESASQLARIPYASSVTVALAYREKSLPPQIRGHGYIIPRIEGSAALACTFVSQKFAHRAPHGHVLFRVFIGRSGQADPTLLRDEELFTTASAELSRTLGIECAPTRHWISRWPQAMPQYELGYLDRLRNIEEDLQMNPGLMLAGAFRGVGIPDCVASGERAANEAIAHLQV